MRTWLICVCFTSLWFSFYHVRYLSTIFDKLLTFRENFLPFFDGACIFLMVMGSFTLHLLKS